jgi:hypothetical protein
LIYEVTVESASLTIYDMLSNIGGLMGLYAGLSVLSFMQFVELAVYLCGCCRRLEPPIEEKRMAPPPSADILYRRSKISDMNTKELSE